MTDRYAERDNALIITVDVGIGDEIQFTKYPNGGLEIEIDEPWAGSTKTGFGATTSVTLTPDDVKKLLEFITH